MGFSASASNVIGDAVTTSASASVAYATPSSARPTRRLDLLSDELRRSGDDDLVAAVELADARGRVVEPDLDELELDRRALLGDRRGRAERVELALRDDLEVVEMDVAVRRPPARGRSDAEPPPRAPRVALPPGPRAERSTRGWTATLNAWTREPFAIARSLRSISSACVASETTTPSPAQTGQRFVRISRGPSVTFWRVISTRPSGEISTTYVFVRSRSSSRAQRLLDRLAVLGIRHVDEVDDDDPADVAQPELADDLLHGLEVVLDDRVLEASLSALAARADEPARC